MPSHDSTVPGAPGGAPSWFERHRAENNAFAPNARIWYSLSDPQFPDFADLCAVFQWGERCTEFLDLLRSHVETHLPTYMVQPGEDSSAQGKLVPFLLAVLIVEQYWVLLLDAFRPIFEQIAVSRLAQRQSNDPTAVVGQSPYSSTFEGLLDVQSRVAGHILAGWGNPVFCLLVKEFPKAMENPFLALHLANAAASSDEPDPNDRFYGYKEVVQRLRQSPRFQAAVASIRSAEIAPKVFMELEGFERQRILSELKMELCGLAHARRTGLLKELPPERYVTLDQAAALVNRDKKTLERYLHDPKYQKHEMPQPDVEGGAGRPHEWRWSRLRPWLEETFKRDLPEHFP
jgi:hypothetical protein